MFVMNKSIFYFKANVGYSISQKQEKKNMFIVDSHSISHFWVLILSIYLQSCVYKVTIGMTWNSHYNNNI